MGPQSCIHETTSTMGARCAASRDSTGRTSVTPLLQTRFDERNGIVSPDGRWLAYQVRQLRLRSRVYVPSLSRTSATASGLSRPPGGSQPLWARSGNELFYVGANGTLLSVPVDVIAVRSGTHGTPIEAARGALSTPAGGASRGRAFDVSPDGQRFLMVKGPATDAGAPPPALIVVQHWDEELKRLVPTK